MIKKNTKNELNLPRLIRQTCDLSNKIGVTS